jgi:hypothetical protein
MNKNLMKLLFGCAVIIVMSTLSNALSARHPTKLSGKLYNVEAVSRYSVGMAAYVTAVLGAEALLQGNMGKRYIGLLAVVPAVATLVLPNYQRR